MLRDSLSGQQASKTPYTRSGYFYERLDDYQKHIVKFILEKKTVGIFAEQGTGKTWIAIAAIEQILTEDFAGLLIVPKANKTTSWLATLTNLPCEVTIDWEHFKKIKGPRIMVVHFEELPKLITKFIRFGDRWDFIGIDEIHKIKARGSRNSRQVCRLRYFGKYRIGLSGTPLEKAPQDVWAQMKFINPSVFGDKWTTFDKRYLVKTGYKGYARKMPKTKFERFIKTLEPWAIRISKEVLNLKPLNIITHELELSAKQQVVYSEMKRSNRVTLPTGELLRAPLTITRNMKLAQIANGLLQTEEGYYWLGSPKLWRIRSILKRCPKPVVIFFRFIPEMIEIEKSLLKQYSVKTYYGKTENRDRIQRGFQDHQFDILLCQARAGGTGIDLYNARTAIIASVEESSITFDQVMARFHRRGQENEIDAHLLIMQKTVDAKTHRRLISKTSKNKDTYYRLTKEHDYG